MKDQAPPDLNDLKLILQRSPLLRALMEVAPEAMQAALKDEFFKAGTVLFHQGEAGDKAYAIWSGRLRVQREIGSGPPLVLGERLPGDLVGEMSLLDNRPRSATVLVIEDSRLISLSRRDFQKLLMRSPEVNLALLRALSNRLRATDDYLADASRSIDYFARRVAGAPAESAQADEMDEARLEGLGLLFQDLAEAVDGVTSGLTMLRRALSTRISDEAAELLDLVSSHARRMSMYLDRLMDWQRLETGEASLELKPVMVGALAERVAARLTPSARAMKVLIDVEVDRDLPMIRADEKLLLRAMTHLVENAMRYAPPETAIKIQVSSLYGRELRIIVSDKGPGVPEEYRERIFDPFVRVPGDEGAGLGLGLALCKAIVQAHGGRIWVEEAPGGQGSSFVISLPLG